jgi:hypothetical protein
LTLAIGGVDAIPADAAGISGNLTVVNPSSNGFAFISPAVVASPTSSTLNAVATKSIANGFDVALKVGGLYLIWCGTAGSKANLQLDVPATGSSQGRRVTAGPRHTEGPGDCRGLLIRRRTSIEAFGSRSKPASANIGADASVGP